MNRLVSRVAVRLRMKPEPRFKVKDLHLVPNSHIEKLIERRRKNPRKVKIA